MKLTKFFAKKNKFLNILIILGVVVLVAVLFRYNNNKGLLQDNMSNNVFANAATLDVVMDKQTNNSGSNNLQQSNNIVSGTTVPVSTTDGEQFLQVSGLSSGTKPTNSCNNQPMMDPKELLPNSANNEWSSIAPSNDLKNINMLNAGHHIGINTVGSSLRNANLQVRSEPVIPQSNVGPWNNTTIEADNLRRPLEIGSSSE